MKISTTNFFDYPQNPQGQQQGQNVYHALVDASLPLLAPTPVHLPSQLVLGESPPLLTHSALQEPYFPTDIYGSDFFFNTAAPPLSHSTISTPSIPSTLPNVQVLGT